MSQSKFQSVNLLIICGSHSSCSMQNVRFCINKIKSVGRSFALFQHIINQTIVIKEDYLDKPEHFSHIKKRLIFCCYFYFIFFFLKKEYCELPLLVWLAPWKACAWHWAGKQFAHTINIAMICLFSGKIIKYGFGFLAVVWKQFCMLACDRWHPFKMSFMAVMHLFCVMKCARVIDCINKTQKVCVCVHRREKERAWHIYLQHKQNPSSDHCSLPHLSIVH